MSQMSMFETLEYHGIWRRVLHGLGKSLNGNNKVIKDQSFTDKCGRKYVKKIRKERKKK